MSACLRCHDVLEYIKYLDRKGCTAYYTKKRHRLIFDRFGSQHTYSLLSQLCRRGGIGSLFKQEGGLPFDQLITHGCHRGYQVHPKSDAHQERNRDFLCTSREHLDFTVSFSIVTSGGLSAPSMENSATLELSGDIKTAGPSWRADGIRIFFWVFLRTRPYSLPLSCAPCQGGCQDKNWIRQGSRPEVLGSREPAL